MSTHQSSLVRSLARSASRIGRDDGGQSLPVVLTLITFLFIIASAMAAHASVALRTTVANEAQGGDLHAASAGAELGIWWQRNGRSGNPPDISVNGKNVSTTVDVAGGASCATRSPILITGFESGAVSRDGGGLFSTISGSGSAPDAAVVRSGGYSLRIDDPSTARAYVTLPAARAVIVARLYLRLDTLPAADVTELLVLDAVSGNDLRLGYQASTQHLTLRFANRAPVVATSRVSADSWIRIDLEFTAGTNPRSVAWQVDGAAQAGLSTSGAATTVRYLRLGSNVSGDTYTVNYDDVVISGTAGDYPIGEGTVVPLRPDGMGANAGPDSFHHDGGPVIDANTYRRLDDDPIDTTSDYVQQDTAGASDYLEVTLSDTSERCIVGVSGLVAYHSQAAARNNGTTRLVDGATEQAIYSGDMSETRLFYRSALIPPTGAWTKAAVNALRMRIGYGTDIRPVPYWDALLVEIATGEGAPGIVTVTATAGASTVTTTYTDAGSAPPVLETWSASR